MNLFYGGNFLNLDKLVISRDDLSKANDERTALLLKLIKNIFHDDVKYRILLELSGSEGYGLRELARRVGVSHSSLKRHLTALEMREVIKGFYVNPMVKVYALSDKFKNLEELLINN